MPNGDALPHLTGEELAHRMAELESDSEQTHKLMLFIIKTHFFLGSK